MCETGRASVRCEMAANANEVKIKGETNIQCAGFDSTQAIAIV